MFTLFSSLQYYYQLFFKAWDEDGTYDATVDYGYYNYGYTSKNYNYYAYIYGRGGGTNVYLYVSHKWYCPANYYAYYCTRYCIYTDDDNGHYSCDTDGYPVCLDGWTGTSTYCKTGLFLSISAATSAAISLTLICSDLSRRVPR